MAKILVVEDDVSLRNMYQLMLEDAGYEVTTAESGEVALAIAEEQQFDLLIADIVLPGMDGVELMKRLVDGSVAMRAIAISGGAPQIKQVFGRADLSDSKLSERISIISKPVEMPFLLAAVKSSLKNELE
ncbi:MAG: response regulator [Bdellovibrionales bacterium]|nr:response regulator [Bdellovibrionales bacterium]